jgi:hypothetical protein
MRYHCPDVMTLTLTIINQTNLEVARIFPKTEIRERLRLYCDDRIRRQCGLKTRFVCGGWHFFKEASYSFIFVVRTDKNVVGFHILNIILSVTDFGIERTWNIYPYVRSRTRGEGSPEQEVFV